MSVKFLVTVQGSLTGHRWHQDVSPRNILVKSRAQKTKHEAKFLLTDFGLSHFRKAMSANGIAQDRHTNGTRTYGGQNKSLSTHILFTAK